MLHSLSNFYNQNENIIRAVFAFLAASGLVSIVLQNTKRWLSLQSPKVIHFLLVVLSFVTVAVNYLIGAASQNPKILGPETLMLVGGASTLYHYAIKPLSNILTDATNLRALKAKQAANEVIVSTVNISNVPASVVAPEFDA